MSASRLRRASCVARSLWGLASTRTLRQPRAQFPESAALLGAAIREPLQKPGVKLAGFDCAEPALNQWLVHKAFKTESRFSRTYVVCDGLRVVAYYCMCAGAVERMAVPGKVRRNAPDSTPVSVIGRLAVSREYAGWGLGADMLADALRRIAIAAQAISAVLVHAKSDAGKQFYLSCAEFIEYPEDSRSLFLPIETVIAGFG